MCRNRIRRSAYRPASWTASLETAPSRSAAMRCRRTRCVLRSPRDENGFASLSVRQSGSLRRQTSWLNRLCRAHQPENGDLAWADMNVWLTALRLCIRSAYQLARLPVLIVRHTFRSTHRLAGAVTLLQTDSLPCRGCGRPVTLVG